MTTRYTMWALAGPFVLFGLVPGTRGGYDGCGGGRTTCPRDEEQAR